MRKCGRQFASRIFLHKHSFVNGEAKNYKRRTVDMITSAHLYKNERSLTYK